MIATFSAADQLRRRPAPVNTSIRRTGSGICLCSEIDMCRSPHPLRQSPFRRQTERCSADTAYLTAAVLGKGHAGRLDRIEVVAIPQIGLNDAPPADQLTPRGGIHVAAAISCGA